jgi:Terminase small subunit
MRTPTKTKTLTEKQQRFVTAYIERLDVRSAAIAAGYSKRSAKAAGVRLLGQRQIIEAIARCGKTAQGGESRHKDAPITKSWITDELTELYRTVKACMPTPGVEDGKAPSGTSLQSAIRMLELLIKHLEDEGLQGREDQAKSEPDLSRLGRDELRQLEAILARTVPETGSAGARGA